MRGRSCWFRGLFLGVMGVLLGAQLSFGAGFALYEGSARGVALGGGLVARADDPSALFYNPAGITQLPGLQVMAGVTAIIPSTDVTTVNPYDPTDVQTSDTETNVWLPPHFYATYQFSDSVWFGLGAFSPFGLGTEFSESWPGRYNNYNAVIKTLTINPNVAFKANDRLSLAVGMEVMWFDLTLENKIDALRQNNPATNAFDIDQSLTGDTFGYGFNFALHYKALDWMALGITYRSQVKQHVDGDADFDRPAGLPLPAPAFRDTGVEGTVTLPDMVFMGVMVEPVERLSFEVGAVWTRWSTFDELKIDYDDPALFGVADSVTRKKDWNDTWRIYLSAEYGILDWLDLRAAYTFDESPIPDAHVDYLVPANDRHLFSFGPGFRWRNWALDLSYTYIYIEDRDVDARVNLGVFESEFDDGNAHLVGFSLGYKF